MKNEISALYEELYEKRIKPLNKPSQGGIHQEILDEIHNEVKVAYSKGRITNDHYSNLKNEISIGYEEEFNKRIDWLKELPKEDVNHSTIDRLTGDITDAYSKGRITELHYELLNERISKITHKGGA
ncbi:MAG: hypothetical protein WBL68_18965 [Nitrososphaeraceae archaeon]